MKCYFAGYTTQPQIKEERSVSDNLLETYWGFKNKDYREYHKKNGLLDSELFLDSGAFSAFTRGVKINIDDYIEYIKKYKDVINFYAGLDVIGDYKATAKNIEYMESKGLTPIPTFHYGSPYSELERLVDEYNYIALGGLVPISRDRKTMQNHLDSCFSIIKTKTRVHGFGVNSLWAWLRYPFYSVDATSWLAGAQFGQIISFDENNLKFIRNNKQNINIPIKAMKFHSAHYTELNLNNAKELKKASLFATRLWESRGVDWNKRDRLDKNNILIKKKT